MNKCEIHNISVIVPTYGRNGNLSNALQSLCSQTFKDFNVIIIDDNGKGSDIQLKNESIVNQYNQFISIKYCVNEENIGSAKSRNVGLENSDGVYITFLDDDDIYLEKNLEYKYEKIKNNNFDLVVSNLVLYDEKGKYIEKRTHPQLISENLSTEKLTEVHLKYHLTGTDCLIFNAEFLRRIGGFTPIDIGDEFYLVLKAIENKAKVGYGDFDEVRAVIHKKGGLSSGENKIKGENELYLFKKKNYFKTLSYEAKKYIIMRHFLVVANSCFKRKKFFRFFFYCLISFCNSPVGFVKIGLERQRKHK